MRRREEKKTLRERKGGRYELAAAASPLMSSWVMVFVPLVTSWFTIVAVYLRTYSIIAPKIVHLALPSTWCSIGASCMYAIPITGMMNCIETEVMSLLCTSAKCQGEA